MKAEDTFYMYFQGQGTEEQKAKWLPLAESYQIIGTYAQTELGHGKYAVHRSVTIALKLINQLTSLDMHYFWPDLQKE